MSRRGSRGAGICLSLGVMTELELAESDETQITVYLNGKESEAFVTKRAVENVLGSSPYEVVIRSEVQLPAGQGFGMSAAGALSSALAVMNAREMDGPMSFRSAVEAAHRAEVFFSTGLGDVIASSFGGMVLRKMEGIPPTGHEEEFIKRIEVEREVVLCVIGGPLSTRDILLNPERKRSINASGSTCMDDFMGNQTLERFFDLSYLFADETELVTDGIIAAVETAKEHGMASMCMLGNSVFAVGDTGELEKVLSDFGEVIVCTIDNEGARFVE